MRGAPLSASPFKSTASWAKVYLIEDKLFDPFSLGCDFWIVTALAVVALLSFGADCVSPLSIVATIIAIVIIGPSFTLVLLWNSVFGDVWIRG